MLTDTWRLLRAFDRDAEGIPLRRTQRRLVMLAAYCGSPASETAAAIAARPALVRQVGTGRQAFADWRDVDQLHDWVAACIWRHLWRVGSDAARDADAIAEARRHAASVSDVPADWLRDWLVAASEAGG